MTLELIVADTLNTPHGANKVIICQQVRVKSRAKFVRYIVAVDKSVSDGCCK